MPLSLPPAADGGAVEMPVAAACNAVFLQHCQDLRTLVTLIHGRIVEKAENGTLPRRRQGGLQPHDLPVQDLGVVGLLLLLQKPAPGTAEGMISV